MLECDIYDELYKMLEYDKLDKDPCFYYRFEEEIRIMFARRLNASLLDISFLINALFISTPFNTSGLLELI